MLDNLTLADRYTTLNERLKELKAEVEALREKIIATGQDLHIGEFADVKVILSERTNFNAEKAKSFLNAEQINACTTKTVVTSLRSKPKTAKEG